MYNCVFVDTSAFKAIIDPEDEFHNKAKRIWRSLREKETLLVTTNYILDESFTLIRARCGLPIVIEFRSVLAESAQVLRIVRVTVQDEASAWKWFERHWSRLSFTDCISFAVMKRLDINNVVTFDKHFERAGYKLINT